MTRTVLVLAEKTNGSFVNFSLMAMPPSQADEDLAFWSFSRHLAGQTFDDEAPSVVLRPMGAAGPAAS